MPERVISNTSPLFYLHRLRRLDLLQRLYQQVLVPEAVVDELNAGRDQGEDVPLVLLDDRLARAVARMRNIRMTGTAGVLLKAKQEGHITAVAPLLERLLQLDFRLSNAVKASILKLARE